MGRGETEKNVTPIMQNSIFVQEIVHTFKLIKRRGSLIIIKLNMMKAYDKVDWNVLLHILVCLRIFQHFISLFAKCLNYIYFKLFLNGYVMGGFKHGKGLRHGDPLVYISIYHFLLFAFQNSFKIF